MSTPSWPHVEALLDLYAEPLELLSGPCTPIELLEAQSGVLHAAHAAGDERAVIQIASWHPTLVGAADSEAHAKLVLSRGFGLDDARLTLAREHGFEDWGKVEQDGRKPFDPAFEACANAVVTGELAGLSAALRVRPELARARSPFAHGATLLHYAGSNGVETWRQMTPANAADVVARLLEAGAERDARMLAHGGALTPLELARSSAHPATAGVRDELLAALGG